jgi:hypothetical protein
MEDADINAGCFCWIRSIVWMFLQLFLYPHIPHTRDANRSAYFPSLRLTFVQAVGKCLTTYQRNAMESRLNGPNYDWPRDDFCEARQKTVLSLRMYCRFRVRRHFALSSILVVAAVHLPVFPTGMAGQARLLARKVPCPTSGLGPSPAMYDVASWGCPPCHRTLSYT